ALPTGQGRNCRRTLFSGLPRRLVCAPRATAFGFFSRTKSHRPGRTSYEPNTLVSSTLQAEQGAAPDAAACRAAGDAQPSQQQPRIDAARTGLGRQPTPPSAAAAPHGVLQQ